MKYIILALCLAGCVTSAKFTKEQACIVNRSSGFKASVYIVTANHVCPDDYVSVIDYSRKEISGIVVARDTTNDICLIKYLNTKLWNFTTADVCARSKVYSVGNPTELYFSELEGEVQNVERRDVDGKIVIQIGIDVHFGSSGSPVYDKNGHLVGVIVEAIPGTRFTFIVPIQKVVLLMKRYERENR